MMSAADLFGLIGAILGVAGALVAVTRYLTLAQEKLQRDAIERDKRELATKLVEAEAQRDQLNEQLKLAARKGSAGLSRKLALDDLLRAAMKAMGASGASLYVPVFGPRDQVNGLAFLCIEPFTSHTRQLRSKIIPLRSLAGSAFLSGISSIVPNVATDTKHFKAAEAIANYKPSKMLNFALRHRDTTVGVLQLMSQGDEAGFEESDIERLQAMAPPIVEQLMSLTDSGEHMPLLGLNDDITDPVATVLFFDISGSTTLLRELSPKFAIQLINEYFEEMCDIAIRNGAAIDNYTGDGALLRFNLPRKQADHELAAITTAMEMTRAFERIRDYWITISPSLALVQNRIGIATGPLVQANLGHSQFQRLTVLGYPISVAATLCDAGPRDRSVVLISDEVWQAVKNRVVATAQTPEPGSKLALLLQRYHEVTALR
jgi:class 3 adenylate cyclase